MARTDLITKATIDDALKALKNGETVGWCGTHAPLIETRNDGKTDTANPYPKLVVTNAALEELKKSGFIYASFRTWEMPGKGLLTFYNPKTNQELGLEWSNDYKAQFGENGPLLGAANLSRLDLIAQMSARDETATTHIAMSHRRNRLIAPKNDAIVIGNEAFLSHVAAQKDSEKVTTETTDPQLSIYREAGHVKFAYNGTVTAIPADKVKTLRIGDQGAFIDPKTITEKPLTIDLPKSIETGKIVPAQAALKKRADVSLPEGVKLAELNASEPQLPSLPHTGNARQI